MNEKLLKQYNVWAESYDVNTMKYDKESRKNFYSFFEFETSGKKLLDIACGSGYDLIYYRDTLKADIYGVDASEEQVTLANKRLGENCVCVGYDYSLPYEDDSFDIIVSKYAPQGFEDIASFYKEVNRVLKPGGYFLILTTHPMRHFMEKTEKPRDYFKKEIVTSWIYDHTLPLKEYSYTLNDYLSPYFIQHFNLERFEEIGDDVSAESINNERYPAYFIYRARKK